MCDSNQMISTNTGHPTYFSVEKYKDYVKRDGTLVINVVLCKHKPESQLCLLMLLSKAGSIFPA